MRSLAKKVDCAVTGAANDEMASASDGEIFKRLEELKVDELKEVLLGKGLSTTGTKQVLKDQLADALTESWDKLSDDKTDKRGDKRGEQNSTSDADEDDEDSDKIDLDSLSVKKLKFRLRRLELDSKGGRSELKIRLYDTLQDGEEDENDVIPKNDQRSAETMTTMLKNGSKSLKMRHVFVSGVTCIKRYMPANYCALQRSCSWASRIANILGICSRALYCVNLTRRLRATQYTRIFSEEGRRAAKLITSTATECSRSDPK